MTKTGHDHTQFATADEKFKVKLAMLQVLEQEIPWRVEHDGKVFRDEDTGHRNLAFCPLNDSDFAKWSLLPGKSQYPEPLRQALVAKLAEHLKAKYIEGDPEFDSHGRSTFSRPERTEMQARAKASFETLKKRADAQRQKENLSDRIAELEANLETEKARVAS
ncbi:MAG: hypothetical protein ABW086_16930, partial [Sedimenticola sp.]